MASLFNSKHNKYFSTPDWFKDTVFDNAEKPSQTIYVSGGGGGSSSGLQNIVLYNKFVLEEAELDNEALINKNIALNIKETDDSKIGDEISAYGWGTTDYISIAGGSNMIVASQVTIDSIYGIIYYDHARNIIETFILTQEEEQVSIPVSAYYFRISTPLDYELFKIKYYKSVPYSAEQLQKSNLNVTNFLESDSTIPEGYNETTVNGSQFKLLVQSPLSLIKDNSNVIKLQMGEVETSNDMFVWDKTLAAFGYDSVTETAYSYIDGKQQFTTNEKGEEVPLMTSNQEFWLYDEEQQDKWIIRSTRPRISWLDGLIEYDNESDIFKIHGNVVASGGITAYADLGDLDLPDIYDGLPLDNDTIGWKYDEDGKKTSIAVIKKLGGGIEKINNGEKEDKKFVKALILNDEGTEINVIKQLLQIDDIPDLSEKYIDRTTDQTAEGWKDFITGIKFNGLEMSYLKEDVVYLDANLVVRGGVTIYGDQDADIPSILEAIPTAGYSTLGLAAFNSKDFKVEQGVVSLLEVNANKLDNPLSIVVDSETYQYDGTSKINVTINKDTLQLDNYYLNEKQLSSKLTENGYRQIIPITDPSYATSQEILYIIV